VLLTAKNPMNSILQESNHDAKNVGGEKSYEYSRLRGLDGKSFAPQRSVIFIQMIPFYGPIFH